MGQEVQKILDLIEKTILGTMYVCQINGGNPIDILKHKTMFSNEQILEQISKLDDSLYGVWYNLGISKILADMSTGYGCFEKSIKLKLDHIDSWKGKKRYHALALNDPIVDDNLDFHINSELITLW